MNFGYEHLFITQNAYFRFNPWQTSHKKPAGKPVNFK